MPEPGHRDRQGSHFPSLPTPHRRYTLLVTPDRDKRSTEAPLALAYFRNENASEQLESVAVSERWVPIWACLLGCGCFALSRLSDLSSAGTVVFLYFCGVGCVLALDGTRRPGKAWIVSLCGLVLTSALILIVLIRVLQHGF